MFLQLWFKVPAEDGDKVPQKPVIFHKLYYSDAPVL